MKGEEHLIPLGDPRRTKEQQREIQSKGGKASQKKQAEKKRQQEEWRRFLEMPMKPGKKDEIKSLSDAKNANMSVDSAMKVRIIQEGLKKGDPRIWALIASWAGLMDDIPEEQTTQELVEENTFLKAVQDSAEKVWANEDSEKE